LNFAHEVPHVFGPDALYFETFGELSDDGFDFSADIHDLIYEAFRS